MQASVELLIQATTTIGIEGSKEQHERLQGCTLSPEWPAWPQLQQVRGAVLRGKGLQHRWPRW